MTINVPCCFFSPHDVLVWFLFIWVYRKCSNNACWMEVLQSQPMVLIGCPEVGRTFTDLASLCLYRLLA